MIPPCRNCDGEGRTYADREPTAAELAQGVASVTEPGPCPRCQGSQLDEAWCFTITSDRPGYAKVRIAYGAHAATRPLCDVELPTEASDLLRDILGGRIRRGLILRERP